MIRIESVKFVNQCKSVIQTIYDIITKGHGGRIEVETEEDNGSTFIISIPIHDS